MLKKMLINGRMFAILLLLLIISLYASWMVNAQLGYGYSWLYEVYDTEQHIARYAPQNRFRQGFETTSVADHKRVFQQIVDSVHRNGEGLEQIHYAYLSRSIPLLHQAELVHLQDVANLINLIHYLGLACILFLVTCVIFELRHRRNNKVRASGLGLLAVSATLLLLLLMAFVIWGAKAIFYQMHILIFPSDHQWFFYYQDSLMSTLMKAPDLFAGIALQITSLGVLFYGLILWGLNRRLKRTRASEG
jgi:uncharacterized membrane protein